MFCKRWQTYCMMCMRMSDSRAFIMARQVGPRSMRCDSGSPEGSSAICPGGYHIFRAFIFAQIREI